MIILYHELLKIQTFVVFLLEIHTIIHHYEDGNVPIYRGEFFVRFHESGSFQTYKIFKGDDKMKKLLLLFFTAVLSITLVACGDGATDNSDNADDADVAEETETEETDEAETEETD